MQQFVLSELSELILCSYEDSFTYSGPSVLSQLLNCNWKNLINKNASLNFDTKEPITNYEDYLSTAISCLWAYCQSNFTGPNLNEEYNDVINIKNARHLLRSDGEELNVLIKHPEFLLFAKQILTHLASLNEIDSNLRNLALWWLLRCLYIYQQSLEEQSQTLYNNIEKCINSLDEYRLHLGDSAIVKDRKFAVILNLEICQKNQNKYLNQAKSIYGIEFEIAGALGKRDAISTKEVAQLKLQIKIDKNISLLQNSSETHKYDPPKLLKLNDDLRLEDIKFSVDQTIEELPSLAQAIILCFVYYHKLSQPKDELTAEELKAYIMVLLKQTHSPWQIRFNSLIELLDIEKTNKRTVERCMLQCEELIKLQNNLDTPMKTRLSYVFMAGLRSRWHTRRVHADLMLSLGLVKTALDTYLELQLWEDVILCYTLLEMKHKAAETIRECLETEETVKLYCLLGDVTDDIKCYEKAWTMSKERSSKAQRHWGNNLYCKAKYQEAIPHFEKSLELNSLQESVWLRLGYAALNIENWVVAANAYRNYTYLEQREFEAWNNLAKAYIKLGDKERAFKVLNEALKCNYDNWQVWENMLVVSIDTGNFSDSIRSYDRLLDLRGKHLDLEILEILAKVITDEKLDAHGQNSKRYLDHFQKLMGRISISHPNDYRMWLIYASLPLKEILVCPKLMKAFKCLTQGNWTSDPKVCEEVVKLCLDMAKLVLGLNVDGKNVSVTDKNEIKEQLSSVRLSCKAAHSAVKNARVDCEKAEELLPQLEEFIDVLTKKVTALL